MAKLIECCVECFGCEAASNDRHVCIHNQRRRVVGIPDWCPKPDGIPAPAPYSADNPLKINDFVSVDLGEEVIFGIVNDEPEYGDSPGYWVLTRKYELMFCSLSKITLLYRPEAKQ